MTDILTCVGIGVSAIIAIISIIVSIKANKKSDESNRIANESNVLSKESISVTKKHQEENIYNSVKPYLDISIEFKNEILDGIMVFENYSPNSAIGIHVFDEKSNSVVLIVSDLDYSKTNDIKYSFNLMPHKTVKYQIIKEQRDEFKKNQENIFYVFYTDIHHKVLQSGVLKLNSILKEYSFVVLPEGDAEKILYELKIEIKNL